MSRTWLLRSSALAGLLSLIVEGCGGGGTSDGSGSDDGCSDEPSEEPVQVPASAVANLQVIDGSYPASACEDLCAPLFPSYGTIYDCGPTVGARGDGESTAGDVGSTGEGDSGEPEPEVGVTCRVENYDCEVGGRRSDALTTDGHRDDGDGVAAWFAAMAHAEAASVVSFLRLGIALAHHGAPTELVAGCRAAARDEARHARIMRARARAGGIEPTRPRHRAAVIPALEQLARENAVEGCVRETWAATQLLWQARTAGDPRLRGELAAVARDEIRHAELAWAIDAWARTQLGAHACRRIDHARVRAVAELAPDRPRAPAPMLGLPTRAVAAGLLGSLRAALWS